MTRYPDAVWRPGPPQKVWPQVNTVEGIVCHSMDGYYATGGLALLDDSNSGVSWPFSITFDGIVYQHYELEASCWQAGDANLNRKYVGIEHEGLHTEPLREPQIVSSVKLCHWIADLPVAWPLVRKHTLFEHRELGTSICPIERFTDVWGRWTTVPDIQTVDVGLIRLKLEEAARQIRDAHEIAGGDRNFLADVVKGLH